MPGETIHASAVSVGGKGVLVRGASGSGKSSLVLALLMADLDRNRLVADDRVLAEARDGALRAAPPPATAGLLEVRGLGIVRLPFLEAAAIHLVVDLDIPARSPRMPEPDERFVVVAGVTLPRLMLPIGQADGAVRVRAALAFWGDLV